ncbi:TonB-dependent receptor [Novosphingobium sp. KCTC 2891]|uniref:TonB-dependent receptor n=1 Tax=Novosphingobium sp. KCTC 2891 TaxID=2989730 RepID=UPI002223AB8E|nr:TonB-dependent receptor [Novosphingobium sp. KCTC 2891]MCW1382546.1 TonB-dependent receptor [Novosphingobium sp. KCTC 2891]
MKLHHKMQLLCGLSAMAFAAPAFAAEPPVEDTGGIAEIVVTAQKKAENLQDVPISVAAIGSDTLESTHAVNLQGLQGAVPNVEIGTFSNTPNTAVFTIRGIGVIEPDPYAGNTVGIVVDGLPQYFSMGALLDLFDVERIEILRGPQGTLFGANTTGGVVNVVNRQPDLDKLGGSVNLSYGNYNHLTASGVLNAPLGEGLALRLGVNHDRRDGYVTNVVTGKDMGRRNVTIFRGALRYSAGDFDATLSGEYDRARNGSPIVVAGDLPGEAEYVPEGFLGMYRSPCLPAGSRCSAPDHYYSAQDGGINGDLPDVSNMDTYRAGLTMKLSNTAIGDIVSITGYKHFKLFEFTDQDGTPVPLIDTKRGTKGWQFSQELRTDVSLGDIGNITVGGFYLKTHYDHYQNLRINFAGGATYNPDGTYVLGLPGLFQQNLQDQDNHSISAFAQSYINVSDRLRLQAGIRYTHEQTSMLASTETRLATATANWLAALTAGAEDPGTPGYSNLDGTNTVPFGAGMVAPPRGTRSWNNVGWKLGFDYKATDDVMLYGYWARGFKSGGYTGRIGIADDLGPYNPEKVDTFEAGVKTELFDRHVRFNLAGFYTNYRGMQLAQIYFKGTGADLVQGNTILNAAASHIKGFESELTVVPVKGVTINGSLAYLDATYAKFDYLLPSGATLDLKGKRLQNAPKWTASTSIAYEFPMGGELSGRFSATYNYTGQKQLTSIIASARSTIQPQHIVNANFDVKVGDHYTVGVWATNLLDSRYINSVFDSPGTIGLTNYAQPRMFGASFKAEY